MLAMDRFEVQELELSMPKFRMNSQLELLPPLSALGLGEGLASPTALGGFSDKEINISGIVQKAVIEVDEKGTEAAAATSMKTLGGSLSQPKPPPIKLIIDRPFVFALRDERRGRILLLGYVGQPST